MKKLVLVFSLLVLGLRTQSQTLKVSVDTVQEMNWPLNVSLTESEKYNLVEYTNLGVGNNTFTFDMGKKMVSLVGSDGVVKEFNLTKYNKLKSGYYFELNHNKYTTKVSVTEQLSGGYALFVMYDYEKGDSKSEGYFSPNIKMEYFK